METPNYTLYELFRRTLDQNTFMLQHEMDQVLELRDNLKQYLDENKYDTSENRNKVRQAKTTYNYLMKRLNEYQKLEHEGMLLAHFEQVGENDFVRVDGTGNEIVWD